MDIDTDMDALRTLRNPLHSTPASLKFEIEDLTSRIQNLIDLRETSVKSLLALLFAKRAKLFELRDKHMLFPTQYQIEALDNEIAKIQSVLFINLFIYFLLRNK